MQPSMLSCRVGGGGGEIAIEGYYLGDFDIIQYPQGGEFDTAAIFEDRENLEWVTRNKLLQFLFNHSQVREWKEKGLWGFGGGGGGGRQLFSVMTLWGLLLSFPSPYPQGWLSIDVLNYLKWYIEKC